MITVFLSDVHGNAVALRRCLSVVAAHGPVAVHCVGDIVGYYPDAEACLDLLDGAGAKMVCGNHEAMLSGRLPLDPLRDEVYRLAALRRTLPISVLHRLASLPERQELEIDGVRTLLVHGSPSEPLTGRVHVGDDLDLHLAGTDAELVIVANTHRPFVRRHHDGTVVVNVGSVGMPRDAGTLASFVVHDPRAGFKVVRVPLDAAELRAAYPDVHPDVHALLDRVETA